MNDFLRVYFHVKYNKTHSVAVKYIQFSDPNYMILSLYSRMGCGSSSEFSDDEPRTVVVFGATGLLGGAVARALLTDPLHFRVRAVTRRPSSEKARKLAEEGIVVC